MTNEKQQKQKAKNNNMLLDLVIKFNRINAIIQQLLDFNNSVEWEGALINKEDYEAIDKAIEAISTNLYNKNKYVVDTYLRKEVKNGTN